MTSTPRIFYGWWLVLASLLIQSIGAGVTIYAFSIFAREVEVEFTASRTLVMLGLSVGSVLSGLLAPFLGGIMDRWSLKWTMIISALIMAVGFFVMSVTPTIWGIVTGFSLFLPIGTAVLLSLSPPILLSRWFSRKRGLALGIAALGTQLGGFTFPPLITLLIEQFDWRVAMQAIGLMIAIVVPLLCWLVVDHPQQRGLLPDGDAHPPGADSAARYARPKIVRTGLMPVLRQKNFWLAGTGIGILVGMFSAVLSNLALIAVEVDASREQAAMLISLYAVVGMVFSPIIGRLCDLFDIRIVFAGILAVSIIAMLSFLGARSYTGMMLATAMVAMVGGGIMPFWGALVGRLFDLALYGRVMGAMSLLVMAASAGSPLLAGWLFDITGSYHSLFILMAALMAIPLLYASAIRTVTPSTSSGLIDQTKVS